MAVSPYVVVVSVAGAVIVATLPATDVVNPPLETRLKPVGVPVPAMALPSASYAVIRTLPTAFAPRMRKAGTTELPTIVPPR